MLKGIGVATGNMSSCFPGGVFEDVGRLLQCQGPQGDCMPTGNGTSSPRPFNPNPQAPTPNPHPTPPKKTKSGSPLQSFSPLLPEVVQVTASCGAVRHGAECFNFYFPQVDLRSPNIALPPTIMAPDRDRGSLQEEIDLPGA